VDIAFKCSVDFVIMIMLLKLKLKLMLKKDMKNNYVEIVTEMIPETESNLS